MKHLAKMKTTKLIAVGFQFDVMQLNAEIKWH